MVTGIQISLQVAKKTLSGNSLITVRSRTSGASVHEFSLGNEHIDALTQLGNRAALKLRLAQLEKKAISTSLVLVDLDRFSIVNDTLGTEIGDALLKLGVKRLRSIVRDGDQIFRPGGDEFALALTNVSSDDALAIARRVIDLLSRPFLIDGEQVNIGASVGVSALPGTTRSSDRLLADANLALTESKERWRWDGNGL